MANRNFPSQRTFSFHMLPVRIDGAATIGSSGAPTLLARSKGIASITRLSAGVYRLQLQDNYYEFLSLNAGLRSPVTASAAVTGGSFSANTVYEILTMGTTTQAQWVAAGVPTGITAAVGVVFKAAGIGAGTGTVKVLVPSTVTNIEILGNPQLMLSNQPSQPNLGGFITICCYGPTSSSVTTLIPTDPASGSTLYFQLLMNNSSIQ